MAHGPSRSGACGIFPDQGSNLCPLHWQADSQPLRHQGSPKAVFLSEGPSIVGVRGQDVPILQMGKLRREKTEPLSWSRHSPAARPGSGLGCASVPSCPALETLGVVGLCGGVGGPGMPTRVPRGALRVGDHVRRLVGGGMLAGMWAPITSGS